MANGSGNGGSSLCVAARLPQSEIDCLEIMREKGLSATGDIMVFIAGVVSGRHSYQRSQTNTMKIIEI